MQKQMITKKEIFHKLGQLTFPLNIIKINIEKNVINEHLFKSNNE